MSQFNDSPDADVEGGLQDSDDAGDIDADGLDDDADDSLDTDDDGTDDADSSDDADDDFDARAEIERLTGETISKAEFEALSEQAKRAFGHIPALQRSVKAHEDSLASLQDIISFQDTLTELLSNSAVLDEDGQKALAKIASDRAVRKQVADAVAKARGQTGDQRDDDGGDAATLVALKAASNRVFGYAEARGVDANQIPQAVWDQALASANGDANKAVDALKAKVDEMANGKGASSRRAARKQAGSKQTKAERGGSATGTITLARLREMSAEEIMALDQDEVDKVLAGG